MNNPKLSIITVNLNNAAGLRKTIESVVSQTFQDFECIIIDGGSTDGSVYVIREFEDKITYWVSEPDKGIYNAMNKGILQAKGEYCLFLNSGDFLINERVVKDVFNIDNNMDIIYSNIQTGNKVWRFPAKLSITFFLFTNIAHPSSFIKRKLFLNSYYNESLKILSDLDFFINKIIVEGCTYLYLDLNCTHFDTNGISNKELDKKEIERQEIIKKYFKYDLEFYLNFKSDITELNIYRNSRIIQFYFKILKSTFYKIYLKLINLFSEKK